MEKPPTSIKSVRLPVDLWERVEARAKVLDISSNAWIRRAVKAGLDGRLIPPRKAAVARRDTGAGWDFNAKPRSKS